MDRLQAISSHLVSDKSEWKCIKFQKIGRIGVITLNRPTVRNALNDQLMGEVGQAIKQLNALDDLGCIILTGEGKAFAAGADIKEMVGRNFHSMMAKDKIEPWELIAHCKVPIIAAVNGMALGGGCEIALMCDIIIASENALFGQPEITIGTIPGAGGTQRLARVLGKSKAMEMCLTGNPITATEALQRGLVSHVVPEKDLMAKTLSIADAIIRHSKPVTVLAKEAVNAAYETTLHQGVKFERRVFQSTFGLEDSTVGMTAFVNKSKPIWKHQ